MTLSLDPEFPSDDLEDDDTQIQTAQNGRHALVAAALAQLDLATLTKMVTSSSSHIVLFIVPNAQWAPTLARYLRYQLPQLSGHSVIELRKDGNRGLTAELTDYLAKGSHLAVVSHDPETLLPPPLLAALDASFTIEVPNVKLLRQAIRNVTGLPVKGLRLRDFAGLDFDALAMALRPGSTPQDCMNRLRRATKALNQPKPADLGPTLADLPLSPDIVTWSSTLLADLRRVESGNGRACDLHYPLLEGPPGTGKTLIISALARSAGWRLVPTSVGSWFAGSDGHLGGVSKAVAGFFNEVLREPYTIGFIDEIDAIPNRATLEDKDREWWTPVVTQILLQIDRIRRSGKPVMLASATNFYDKLDSALTRSGRLEHRIAVLPPRTSQDIAAIFTHHLAGALDPAVVDTAARLSVGKTPADIESVVRAARSRAAAASRPMLAADLLDSVAPAELRTDVELRVTALHEAGHAIVSLALGNRVEAVSIMAQGQSGGYMRAPMSSRLPDRIEVENLAMVMLGGRAADMALGKAPMLEPSLTLPWQQIC